VEKYTHTVKFDEAGLRLDVLICRILASSTSDISRSRVQKMIKKHKVTVNNITQKASYRLREDEVVNFSISEIKMVEKISAEPISLNIIHEDSAIIVINKPAGMTVHPGAGNESGTMVNALLNYTESLSDKYGNIRPGIVHRLDKTTSGVILVAKNNPSHSRLERQFKKTSVKKEYRAVIEGDIQPPVGRIRYAIARDRYNKIKMTIPHKGGREAETRYNLLERFVGYNYIQLFPIHGRTHQIRVHLSYYGHPVLGDTLYGKGGAKWKAQQRLEKAVHAIKGNALHALSIEFVHPETDETMKFHAPLPGKFEDLLDTLRTHFSNDS